MNVWVVSSIFKIGEKIAHQAFGTGIVADVKLDGINTVITVDFSAEHGRKKLRLKEANKFITKFSEFRHYDEDTNDWYNDKGFNEQGFDKEGYDELGFNKQGFNREGIHKDTNDYFDLTGYDMNDFDRRGFDKFGMHKETGTKYDENGYDRSGEHKVINLIKMIWARTPIYCDLRFDGFYHMTHFQNAASIFKTGKLLPRSKRPMVVDMEKMLHVTSEVLKRTNDTIQDYVRLYFRPKTPAFWYFEQMNEVVMLKFSPLLLAYPNVKMTIGNAGTASLLYDPDEWIFDIIDFEQIFLSTGRPLSDREKQLRQSELLIPNELHIGFLKEVLFRSEKERQTFIKRYGRNYNIKFKVDNSVFF